LHEQLGERLYAGLLTGEPVLVVSTRGVDGGWVDSVVTSLQQADADVLGVWWLTDRLVLDDESEVEELSSALELSTDGTDRLTRNLAMQLGDVLFGAAEPATEEEVTGVVPTAPAEPALLARLRETGFV